jgi:hypothetical protein
VLHQQVFQVITQAAVAVAVTIILGQVLAVAQVAAAMVVARLQGFLMV